MPAKKQQDAKGKGEASEAPHEQARKQSDKLIEDAKKILQKGNQSRVQIKEAKGEFVYLSVSVTVAFIVTIFLPFITLFVILLALLGLVQLDYAKAKN